MLKEDDLANPSPSQSECSDVWVVEDNVFLRETIAELLHRPPQLQCRVAVPTCEEAVVALQDGLRPQVLLMDLGLPGMSGLAGIRRVRSIAPSVSVVVLTVHEDDDSVFDALCAGATGYLLKPASAQQILDAVQTVLDGGAPMNALIAKRVLSMFSQLSPLPQEYGLTEREREILQLATAAYTKRRIASALGLSVHTVDTHLRNIYTKLQVTSRSGAVAKAIRERLV